MPRKLTVEEIEYLRETLSDGNNDTMVNSLCDMALSSLSMDDYLDELSEYDE